MGRKRKRSRRRSSGPISRRTALLGLAGGAIGATGFFTTGAFESVAGDRPFDIATAGDDTALLGVDIDEPSGRDGERVTLLELTNRFDEPFESVDAEVVSSGDLTLRDVDVPDFLSPGGSAPITAELSCGQSGQRTVEIAVTATGAEQSVDLVRSVELTCLDRDRGVCAPRELPPGCVDDEFPPWGSTDCSVVIDTAGEVTESIRGGVEIGGAAEIATNGEVDLTHRGSVTEYLSIDTSDEIDLLMGGGSTIGGALQLSTTDEVTATVRGLVGDGLCVDESGELDVSVGGGGRVDGPVSLTSDDEVSVALNDGASVGPLSVETSDEINVDATGGSEINGNVDIDTGDELSLTLEGNERVRGDVSITSDEEVDISLAGSSVIEGDVTVETTDEVDIELRGSSSIEGSVTVAAGDDVGIEIRGSSSIGGNATIDTTGEASVSDCSAVGGSVTPPSACG